MQADMMMRPDETKSKLPRWNINRSALYVLEQVFDLEKFPSHHMRQRLAADLAVTPRQVQVWFQNRRQRERNNCRPGEQPSTSLDSVSSGCTEAMESAGEAWNDATLAHAISSSMACSKNSMGQARPNEATCLAPSPVATDQASQHMAGALAQMPGTQHAYSSVPGAYAGTPVHPHDNMARVDAGSQSQLAQYLIHFENTFRQLRQVAHNSSVGPQSHLAPQAASSAAFCQAVADPVQADMYSSAMNIAAAYPPPQQQQYSLPVPSQQQHWVFPNHPGQHMGQHMGTHPGQHMGSYVPCTPAVQPQVGTQLAAMQGDAQVEQWPMQGVASGVMPAASSSENVSNTPCVNNIVRSMSDDDLQNIFAEEIPEVNAQGASAHAQAHVVRTVPTVVVSSQSSDSADA